MERLRQAEFLEWNSGRLDFTPSNWSTGGIDAALSAAPLGGHLGAPGGVRTTRARQGIRSNLFLISSAHAIALYLVCYRILVLLSVVL